MNAVLDTQHPNFRKYKFTVVSEYGEERCILGVRYYLVLPPDRYCRDSDVDFYGYREIDFDVLHEDGSPWPEADEEVKSDRGLEEFFLDQIIGEGW
jgi:hypothetical protein